MKAGVIIAVTLAVGAIGGVYLGVYWAIPALRHVGSQLRQMGAVGPWLGLALFLGMGAVLVVCVRLQRVLIRVIKRRVDQMRRLEQG